MSGSPEGALRSAPSGGEQELLLYWQLLVRDYLADRDQVSLQEVDFWLSAYGSAHSRPPLRALSMFLRHEGWAPRRSRSGFIYLRPAVARPPLPPAPDLVERTELLPSEQLSAFVGVASLALAVGAILYFAAQLLRGWLA